MAAILAAAGALAVEQARAERPPPPRANPIPTAPSPVKAGTLVTELPSLHCLSFRWYVAGDANQNAAAQVSYRPVGSRKWRPAQPLLRCHFFAKTRGSKLTGYIRRVLGTAGWGHVIAHNRVAGWGDGISLTNYSVSGNIEIYGNDISEVTDDGIEADFIWHNGRMYGNRFTNCFVAGSFAPILGGPAYFIRNELYNTTEALKLQRQPTGLFIYHNSGLGHSQGTYSPSHERWRNVFLRNNLFLGSRLYAIQIAPAYFRVDFDYCGWRKIVSDPENRFFKWNNVRYPTLAALHKAGLQPHSIRVDLSVWKRAADPAESVRYAPGSKRTPDFTLGKGSLAIDRGVVLANINDGFAGKAPDIGSREAGSATPVYGPRKTRQPSLQKR